MSDPVFRLEGILRVKDEPSDFEGPLTLILSLLSKNKIEIRDIRISLILEQFLEFIDAAAELDLNIASDFIAMASHLTYIKTKMMLSGGEEVTELQQLISSLEELSRSDLYVQIKSAAQSLSGMYLREGAMMAGPPEYLQPDTEYRYTHTGEDLMGAIMRVIGRENAVLGSMNPREPVYPRRIIFSIPERISEILEKLKLRNDIPVIELFYESGSRNELIATLIAVLELCRVGSVRLTGGEDDMTITYTGIGRDPGMSDFATDWHD